MIVVNKDTQEEIRVLDDGDRKVLNKQVEKLIAHYTSEIGSLNIQINRLENQISETYDKREENKQ